jgi:hypothetical protein
MTLQNRIEGAAFLGFGDYHHLALNVWRSGGGRPPPPETTGLYHFAIRYATRRELAAAFKRVLLTHRNRAITRDAVLPANRPASGGGTDRTVDRCHGDSGTHVSICIRS